LLENGQLQAVEIHILITYIVLFIGTHFYHSYIYSKITCIL